MIIFINYTLALNLSESGDARATYVQYLANRDIRRAFT